MAKKTSYFISSSSVLLPVLLLLLHYPNFCHAAEEHSRCGCPDTDLTKNSVSGESGAGIPFIKRSHGGWNSRSALLSGKPMNSLMVAAATVALYGITVALFAYLSLKFLKFRWLHMSGIASNLVNLSSMDDFDEYDHIMSRRRIRVRGHQKPKAR